MKDHFLIRCDASTAIGVGHFMRTFCLAHELRSRGHVVTFAMRTTTPLVARILQDEHIPLCPLPTDGPMEGELPYLATRIRDLGVACVVVDHYGAAPTYFAGLCALPVKLGAVDDLADRDLTALDWVLNQNLGAEKLTYRIKPTCRTLLGTRYCLLRPQFLTLRSRMHRRLTAADNKVLITLGGGDIMPFLRDIWAAVYQVPIPLSVRLIVAGDSEPNHDLIQSLGSTRHTLEILHNVADMAEQMAWADLSINGGGSTSWELCSLGVPMVVLPLSHDQEAVADLLDNEGCAIKLRREQVPERLAEKLQQLLQSPDKRAQMSAKSESLIDGLGAHRAASSLEKVIGQK